MILRIPQRKEDDCVICTVAMVMGPPYTYERVERDSERYEKVSAEGKFTEWWVTYLRDKGFDTCYCKFDGLHTLGLYAGCVVGILGMDIPHLERGHVVAVDEIGVIDPADNAPDHIALSEYVLSRLPDGVRFHQEWLAIRRLNTATHTP